MASMTAANNKGKTVSLQLDTLHSYGMDDDCDSVGEQMNSANNEANGPFFSTVTAATKSNLKPIINVNS